MKTDIFASKGKNDAIPEGDPLLYASDAMFLNGKYYLYFCTPDQTYSEGVAVSDSPLGPFLNAKKLNIEKYKQIDPAIILTTMGGLTIYWGQFTLKGAKMKPNMVELDEATIKDSLLNIIVR